jgi:hypothetical protein
VGILTLDAANIPRFLIYSALILALENSSVALLLGGLGLAPSIAATALVLSVASLSTLLPTAPAYIGTYQLAFVISFDMLGWTTSAGLAASVLLQLAYFVPVMIVGLVLALRRYGTSAIRESPASEFRTDSTPEVSYAGRDLEALADMPNYYDWILADFQPYLHGRIVEYGSGAGTVSEKLLPHSTHLTLIEPSANLVASLQERFRLTPSVEIVGSTLETHVASVPDACVDAAVLVNVLEHVEDDQLALSQLVRMLKSGGAILLFVPAMPQLMSEFDRLIGHHR